jgi:N-acetylglucosaminyldiphosphoundecaprenol N-acetyl-beta-D-mannosaminyltransferase
MLERISILNIPIHNLTMPQAVAKVDEFVQTFQPHLVVTPNPEMIVASETDAELRGILSNAALALADGVGVVLAGKMMGTPFQARVPGIDLMQEVVKLAAEKQYGIYLLGASPAAVQTAAKNLKTRYPMLRVLGTMHGYFKEGSGVKGQGARGDDVPETEEDVIADILDAQPDILFIGMGSPRQEKLAARYLQKLRVPVILCVGGSFDVISGYLKRAPRWMQVFGIEWLYRLFQQPSRWRRMLVLPVFLGKVLKARFIKGDGLNGTNLAP